MTEQLARITLPPMDEAVRALLEAARRAHGVARWDELAGLRFAMLARAPLLVMRWQSPFRREYQVEISTREPRTMISPFGRTGGRGIYAGDYVRLESPAGELLAERHGARVHARSHLRWDDLDLLYLFGYSFWNYHSFPFLFARSGFHAVELEPVRDPADGQRLRRLRLCFPPELPAHAAEQTFYFDERSMIVRFDYGAEILNPNRRGAHLCTEYRDWDGLMVAGHRRAVPFARGTRPLPLMPVLMEARVDRVELLSTDAAR